MPKPHYPSRVSPAYRRRELRTEDFRSQTTPTPRTSPFGPNHECSRDRRSAVPPSLCRAPFRSLRAPIILATIRLAYAIGSAIAATYAGEFLVTVANFLCGQGLMRIQR